MLFLFQTPAFVGQYPNHNFIEICRFGLPYGNALILFGVLVDAVVVAESLNKISFFFVIYKDHSGTHCVARLCSHPRVTDCIFFNYDNDVISHKANLVRKQDP